MLGIPMEPTPIFPEKAKSVLLTESALADPDMIEKLTRFVEKGGNAVITTGFLRESGDSLMRAGLTEARLTGKTYRVSRYQITGDMGGYMEDRMPVLFPEIVHGNNESWSLVNGGDADLHTTLLLRSTYGKGRLYTMSIPDQDSDLYRMPKAVVDVLKRILCGTDYVTGRDFSVFTYQDGSMILYRYVQGQNHPQRVTFHTTKEVNALLDEQTGIRIPVTKIRMFEDFKERIEYTADVLSVPGVFKKYRWV